jgi:hypothetical protein
MKKNGDGMKRILTLSVIVLTVLGSSVSHSYGEGESGKTMWGFSFLGGPNAHSNPNLVILAFLPRFDLTLHKKWDLEFEGNFSYYGISDSKNLYLSGLNTNILFKPIQWNKGSLFLVGGIGGAYNNNNGEVRDLGDSHIAGILQGGVELITVGVKSGGLEVNTASNTFLTHSIKISDLIHIISF